VIVVLFACITLAAFAAGVHTWMSYCRHHFPRWAVLGAFVVGLGVAVAGVESVMYLELLR
jgi:hypothetical protein